MRLGLIGSPLSGRRTVFAALTGREDTGSVSPTEAQLATVAVRDSRLDFLAALFKPKKTTYARIEYLLPPEAGAGGGRSEGGPLSQVRGCDALLHVVRNFRGAGREAPTPEKDLQEVAEELVLNDLLVTEKRVERIEADLKKGRKPEGNELSLLRQCQGLLADGKPLRRTPELAAHPLLKGFAFLTAKPLLVLFNNGDEDERPPFLKPPPGPDDFLVVRGRLEMEIAAMDAEEAAEFREAYHIQGSALDRVIQKSFGILDRICFFTVNADEARAWPIKAGSTALEAAGAVHSDIQRGFIRAETVAFDELKACGSLQQARKAGLVRLEGKDYRVKDGDVIYFRFHV